MTCRKRSGGGSFGTARAAAALLAAALLTGCGPGNGNAPQEPSAGTETSASRVQVSTRPEPETETEPETEPEERIEIDGKIRSYLTGEMTDTAKADRRPLAVMISNDREAQPSYGLNRAGVVYEAPVEGSMNRYMALIEDYDDLERIGSVRSCRTYYIYFAREFEAVFAHFGQSTFAEPYLKYVDSINGLKGAGGAAFYRSRDRKAPHNAYTSFEGIQKAIGELGYSREYPEEYEGHYRCARTGEPVELGDDAPDAFRVVPGYAYNQPYFEYHEDDGLYYRYQYGALHEGSEGPVAVRNIILQYCSAGYYATTPYRDIDVHTGQYGYFITGGKAIPVSWEKDGEFGVTHYYDTEHEEITLNQGKTWVCIIPTSDFPKTEIHGKE